MEFTKRFKARETGRRITIGAIYDENLKQMFFGVATCKPGDAFNKKNGHDKSLGRAKSRKPYHIVTVPLPSRDDIKGYFYEMATTLEEQKNTEIELRLQVEANLRG